MTPTEIKLHQQSHVMEITFENGRRFELPYEYLRVYSPSADVRGSLVPVPVLVPYPPPLA